MMICFFQFSWRKCNEPKMTPDRATIWIVAGILEIGVVACVLGSGGFW